MGVVDGLDDAGAAAAAVTVTVTGAGGVDGVGGRVGAVGVELLGATTGAGAAAACTTDDVAAMTRATGAGRGRGFRGAVGATVGDVAVSVVDVLGGTTSRVGPSGCFTSGASSLNAAGRAAG